jgi:hypothetical protein
MYCIDWIAIVDATFTTEDVDPAIWNEDRSYGPSAYAWTTTIVELTSWRRERHSSCIMDDDA